MLNKISDSDSDSDSVYNIILCVITCDPLDLYNC